MQKLLDRDLQIDDPIKTLAELVHQAVERLGLGNRSRKAGHDGTRGAVRLAETVADDADHDLVRDVLPRRQDGLRLPAQRGAGLYLRAEHVTGRDVRDAKMRAQHVGLRPFARARGAVEEQVHLMNPRYWRITSWVCSCFIVDRKSVVEGKGV